MSAPAASSRPQTGWTVLFVVLAAAWLVCEFVAVARTPFLSEDWTHLAEMRAVPTLFGALDPRLEPLRPFQHAFFWVLAHCGADPAGLALPLAAHAFGFALHAASCVLVYLLARAAGARTLGALVALALFVAFPNVKGLAWSAAIGSPGRVCFELAALLAFVWHVRAPSAKRGATALVLFGLSLAWHESAMLLPAFLVLWIAFVDGESVRAGLRKLGAAARDPWIRVLAAAAIVYCAALVLRPGRHHQVKSLDALPANLVKAATALWPEDLRTPVVDGLRGIGVLPAWTAGFVLVAVAVVALVLAWRSHRARFVLCACAADLGLSVLGAGFVQRYACLASAFVAVGLGLWIARHGGALRGAVIAVVALSWARDSYVDARDYRELERAVPAFVAELRQLRAAEPGAPIALVDPPDMVGAERDVPVFNWGLDFMLAAHHVDGPWLYWRTGSYRTSTNVELVDPATLERAHATGTPKLHGCAAFTRR